MSDGDQLVEFIKDRLDEDEQIARRSQSLSLGSWPADYRDVHNENASPSVRFQARFAEDRVLRAVEAKRGLLTLHGAGMDDGDTMAHECPDEIDPGASAFGVTIGFERDCLTLRLLASEWSTHPEYRREWTP